MQEGRCDFNSGWTPAHSNHSRVRAPALTTEAVEPLQSQSALLTIWRVGKVAAVGTSQYALMNADGSGQRRLTHRGS